jgi:molybdopterin-guanine dinucleotide biosynthesis protein A
MKQDKITDIDACIMAGGQGRRFGEDKSLYIYRGKTLIEHVLGVLDQVFDRVTIAANEPEKYSFLNKTLYQDIIPNLGPLGGIYTALKNSAGKPVFISGCDTPFITPEFLNYLVNRFNDTKSDICIPLINDMYEPLHAVYSPTCIEAIEELIQQRKSQVYAFYDKVTIEKITSEDLEHIDSWERNFYNINYFEDIERLPR